MTRYPLLYLIMLIAVTSAISCTGNKASTYKKTRPLMDTIVSITVASADKDSAEKAIDSALSEIERFGNLIDFYSDKSELSEINRNAGLRPVRVSPETMDLIVNAVAAAERSGGAFDPTVGVIVRLWDFANRKMPSDDEIKLLLPLVNYRDIIVDRDNSTVFLKRKGMLMDLGGIAKGYAADLAVESFRRNGISSGLVAIAGDIRAFGLKPDGSEWNVGIKNPRQTSDKDEIMAKIRLKDRAISTAGDYERFFILSGKKYHHILDPKTGYPAYKSISVSVVADTGALTDGFDNAVFVLGPEKGLKLLKEMGLDAVITDANGATHVTDGIREKLTFEKRD